MFRRSFLVKPFGHGLAPCARATHHPLVQGRPPVQQHSARTHTHARTRARARAHTRTHTHTHTTTTTTITTRTHRTHRHVRTRRHTTLTHKISTWWIGWLDRLPWPQRQHQFWICLSINSAQTRFATQVQRERFATGEICNRCTTRVGRASRGRHHRQ